MLATIKLTFPVLGAHVSDWRETLTVPKRKRIQREHTEDWHTIQQYTRQLSDNRYLSNYSEAWRKKRIPLQPCHREELVPCQKSLPPSVNACRRL